jgi:hypothetical protein
MPSPSYAWRIGLLLVLIVSVALYDFLRHGPASTRWREYLFLLLGGLVGALFGGINDVFITSRISPEYFRFGKGITPGEGFTGRVATLGLLAGFGPGALVSCVYLYTNSRRTGVPPLPWTSLAQLLAIPPVSAIACAFVLPFCFSTHDPLSFHAALKSFFSADQLRRFLLVWWIHGSLYLGAILGLASGVFIIHRSRVTRIVSG